MKQVTFILTKSGSRPSFFLEKTFCPKIHFLSILGHTFTFLALPGDGESESCHFYTFFLWKRSPKSSLNQLYITFLVYLWRGTTHARGLLIIALFFTNLSKTGSKTSFTNNQKQKYYRNEVCYTTCNLSWNMTKVNMKVN